MAKTMEEIAVEIKTNCANCNEALKRGAAGMVDYVACKKALDNSVNEYNTLWTDLQYREFMGAEVPMIAAIKARTIKAFSVTVKKNKDTGVVESVSVTTKNGEEKVVEKDIDLVSFEEWAVNAGYKRVSVSMQWRWVVEKFNYLMNIRTGREIGGDNAATYIQDNFVVSDDARKCEMALPTGNKEMVKLLQSIVDMIVFIDSGKAAKDGTPLNTIKVDERDIKYIEKLMCSRSSAAKVSMSRDTTMRCLITDALYRNLVTKDYGFDFDRKKAEVKALPGFTLAETKAMTAESEGKAA